MTESGASLLCTQVPISLPPKSTNAQRKAAGISACPAQSLLIGEGNACKMETDIVSFEYETQQDFSDNSQLQLQGTNVKDVCRQARNFMTVLWAIALRWYFLIYAHYYISKNKHCLNACLVLMKCHCFIHVYNGSLHLCHLCRGLTE